MKYPLAFGIFISIFATAVAGEPAGRETYALATNRGYHPYAIFSEKECLGKVEELNATFIKEGLSALQNQEQNLLPIYCLYETLANWPEHFHARSHLDEEGEVYFPFAGNHRIRELARLKSRTEAEEAELVNARDQRKRAREQMSNDALIARISSEAVSFDWNGSKLARQAWQELRICVNPFSPGSKEFAAYREASKNKCDGKWLPSKESWKEGLAKLDEARSSAMQRERYFGYHFHQPDFFAQFDREKLLKLAETFSNADTREALEKSAAEIQKMLGDPAKLIEQYRRLRPGILAERDRILSRDLPEQAESNALNSLLRVYLRSLKSPSLASSKEICKTYAREQRRNAKFLEMLGEFELHHQLRDHDDVTPEIVQLGMPEAEMLAIRSFTSSFYVKLNAKLREGKLSPDLDFFLSALDEGLSRIPPYRGKPVTRFTSLPEAALAAHEVGKVVCYPAYTSTSKNSHWHWPGHQKFLIYPGHRGKAVEKISIIKREEEVLFERGTCFKVLSRQPSATDPEKTEFVMAEVDEQGNVIADVPKETKP